MSELAQLTDYPLLPGLDDSGLPSAAMTSGHHSSFTGAYGFEQQGGRAAVLCLNSPPKSFSILVTCINAGRWKEAKPTFSPWPTPLGSAIMTHLSVAYGFKLKLVSKMS